MGRKTPRRNGDIPVKRPSVTPAASAIAMLAQSSASDENIPRAISPRQSQKAWKTSRGGGRSIGFAIFRFTAESSHAASAKIAAQAIAEHCAAASRRRSRYAA